MHFFIEHNFGHHMRVATEDDPATSQRGDWLYARWVRSIVGGLRSAWAIESKRVTRAGHSPLSLHNEVLRFFLIEAAALAAVAIVLSPLAAVAWMGAALIGVLTLETVNYVEHYGLRRELNAKGLPERVQPHHSWNSNHSLGRVLLFNLTRHSDHHANPRRPYPVLRHFDNAPQLPTGYPGMMLLSAFPPLFHAVMHRELDRIDAESEAGPLPA
jgi:alkane 1-monooxygenase